MAFVAKTAFNPMSVATNGCLISSPSLFAPSQVSYKPIKFQLYCKPISSFSPLAFSFSVKKEDLFRVCVVADQGYEENLSLDESGVEEEEVDAPEGGYFQPPEGAKVYVGNMPFDVDHDSLAQLFQQAGVVEIAEGIFNRMSWSVKTICKPVRTCIVLRSI